MKNKRNDVIDVAERNDAAGEATAAALEETEGMATTSRDYYESSADAAPAGANQAAQQREAAEKDARLAEKAKRIAELEAPMVDQVPAGFLQFRLTTIILNLEFLIFLLFCVAGYCIVCTLYSRLSQAPQSSGQRYSLSRLVSPARRRPGPASKK